MCMHVRDKRKADHCSITTTQPFATVRVYTHGNRVTSSLDNLRTIAYTNCGVVDGQGESEKGSVYNITVSLGI
jgi:hypothetical protein